MVAFLPSEVARLVLGYLESQGCTSAYASFLSDCKHLEECRGREFFTTFMGMTLMDILDDYCAVHSYVFNSVKSSDEMKSKVNRCCALIDKISLLMEKNPPSQEAKCNKTPSNSPPSVADGSSNRNHPTSLANKTFSSTSLRSHGEKSSVEPKYNECMIRSTSLCDLPGYRYNLDYKINNRKNKEDIVSHTSTDNVEPLKKALSPKDNKGDSGRRIVTPDRTLSDFSYALGLVKSGEINTGITPSKVTPPKRKNIKPKISSLSMKKCNNLIDNFSNESLDVTTITNAMLDCTELHEKIADNINAIINSSKNDALDAECTKFEKIGTPFKDLNNPELMDDDTQQLNHVIKAIVEKTEKDPLFDHLLNEVLVASLDSATGSDSDVLSRPETSTPEKSCPSTSNVGSPESCFSYETEPPRYDPKVAGPQKSPLKESKLEPSREKNIMSNINNSEITKYPRKPRGGKKMDILRENYKNFHFEESNDTIQSLNDFPKPPTESNEIVESKSEQKVIILSNELIKSNISSVISVNDTKKKIQPTYIGSGIEDSELMKTTKADCDEKKIKLGQFDKLHLDDDATKSYTIENGTTIKVNRLNKIENTNVEISEIHEISNKNTNQPNDDNVRSEITRAKVGDGNMRCLIPLNNTFTMMSGKPPEIILSNSKIFETENIQPTNRVFTEAEIMKMPTVIMLKSAEDTTDTFELKTLNWNSLLHSNNCSQVKSEKCSTRKNEIPILPRIKNLDDIVSLMEPKHYNAEKNPNSIMEYSISLKTDSVNSINITAIPDEKKDLLDCNIDVDKIETESHENDFPPDKVNTPQKSISKKNCSSTPSRKYAHVRVLDFNTPPRLTSKRKALTSPKSVHKNRKIFKKSAFKSRLFSPLIESGNNSKSELNVSNNTVQLHNDSECIKTELSDAKLAHTENILPTPPKMSISDRAKKREMWDANLRALAVTQEIKELEVSKRYKKKSKKKKIKKAPDLSTSIEVEGKLLEEALLDKSVSFELQDKKSLDSSDDNIILDSIDLKNSDKKQSKGAKNSKPKKDVSKKPTKKYDKVKGKKKNNAEKSSLKNSQVKSAPKKSSKKSSIFKVKIAPKSLTESTKKTNIDEPLNSKSSNHRLSKGLQRNKNEEYINKDKASTSDNTREAEIHITPEFPRDIRVHPTSVKCNLSSLLETPFKQSIFDICLTTPKFLSPTSNTDPISAIKILGMPTPNFGTPLFATESNLLEIASTPGSQSSKHTGYASSGSYYKPDEIDSKMAEVRNDDPAMKSSENIKNTGKTIAISNIQDKLKTMSPKHTQEGDCIPSIDTKVNLNDSSMVLRPRRTTNRWSCLLNKKNSPKNIKKNEIKPFSDNKIDTEKLELPSTDISHGDQYSDKCKEKENLKERKSSHESDERCFLEEKRKRVISKMNMDKPVILKKKPANLISKVIKVKELNKSVQNKKKITKNGAYEKTPIKSPSLEICPPSTSKFMFSNKNYLVPLSKSRRKSSTPRKLEKLESEELEACTRNLVAILNNDRVVSSAHESPIGNSLTNFSNSNTYINIHNNEINGDLCIRPDLKTNANIHYIVPLNQTSVSDICQNISSSEIIKSPSEDIHIDLCDEEEFGRIIKSPQNTVTLYKSEIEVVNRLTRPDESHFVQVNDTVDHDRTIESVANEIVVESSQIDTEVDGTENDNIDEDIIVWYSSECNRSTPHYICCKESKVRESFIKLKGAFLNNYVLNANVYNSVQNAEETRTIKPTKFESLFSMSPNSKVHRKSSETDSDQQDRKKSKGKHSSSKSKSTNKSKPSDVEGKSTDAPLADGPETKTPLVKKKSSKNAEKRPTENVHIDLDDELMTFAIVGSKRKRDSDGALDGAKRKSIISQQILKDLDIEEILSQLHPK